MGKVVALSYRRYRGMKLESKYDAEIERLEIQVNLLRGDIYRLVQLRAEELSEFSVGDDVEDKKGKRGKVIKVIPSSWGKPEPLIQLYKKDGTLGERKTIGYGFDNWHRI